MEREFDTFFTDDRIFAFVDGRTTMEEDKIFFARMTVDRDFSSMIDDMKDASNAIAESVEADTSVFDYSRTALAAFCDNDLNASENTDKIGISQLLPIQKTKKMVDDFWESLDENEQEEE